MPPLTLWPAVLLVSLALLVKGADWFTAAAERLGLAFGLPAFIVGVTIVAAGTSLPELVSSVLAVLRGAPEIVAGNVVGSNVANLLLVLGVAAAVVGRVRVAYALVRVDLPFLAGSGLFLALVLANGAVTAVEGVFCLSGLAIYMAYAVQARRPAGAEGGDGDGGNDGGSGGPGADRPPAAAAPARASRAALLRPAAVLVASGAVVYLAADYAVRSVVEIADLVGVGGDVIAASAVALGTSLPEVSVGVSAVRRGQAGIAVGNVVGSNVFNAFAVTGAGALVGGPLPVADRIVGFALPVMVIATLLAVLMLLEGEITTWEGWLLVLFYAYFLGALFGLV